MQKLSFPQVVVLGSTNWDISMYLPHLPEPGETVSGGVLQTHIGGKGANQAVAAYKAGAQMRFISSVGDDAVGQTIRLQLAEIGLNTDEIRIKTGSTGTACIFIDQQAENCIGLTAGANGLLSTSDVEQVSAMISEADYLLMQLETPLETLQHAAATAKQAGTQVVLNPAPAQALPMALLEKVDIITPNRGELAQLTSLPVTTEEEVLLAARALLAKGVQTVVVTLGSEGCLLVKADTHYRIAAQTVEAVDTTAAGDTFNGYLVANLAKGLALNEAASIASMAAGISVTRKGAIASIPSHNEIAAIQS